MLADLIKDAESNIREALSYGSGIVAYSGGKDGYVVADLCHKIAPNIEMICETSFYFPEQIRDIQTAAKKRGYNITYKCSLDDDFLHNRMHILFSEKSKDRQQSFHLRHQRSMKLFAKEKGATVTFTGRRTQENFVKKKLYTTVKDGLQSHPLRLWRTSDIWEYFAYTREPKSWIYTTEFGRTAHNAPFYSLNKSHYGMSMDNCWQAIRDTSKEQTFEERFRK